MNKFSLKLLLAAPAVISAGLLNASSAIAAPEAAPVLLAQAAPNTIGQVESMGNPLAPISGLDPIEVYNSTRRAGQVTSVSQLTDVSPTDWAYQALQSLVDRYGCIQGYPNRTYRGNRAMTRYEFAAGLNACMDRVNDLIAQGTADLVKKSDLDAIKRLQEEFQAELNALRERLNALEGRTAKLEAQQFSTTTKLSGEAIFSLAGVIDGDNRAAVANPSNPGAAAALENTTASYRVRLNFDTTFSGRDRLRTRLQAINVGSFGIGLSGTNMTRLNFDGGTSGTSPNIELHHLQYRTPIFGNARINIDMNQGEFDNVFPTLSAFASAGTGALSRFGRFNPIYRITTGIGLHLELPLAPQLDLTLGYMVPQGGSSPAPGTSTATGGIFGGQYTAMGQLTYRVSPGFTAAFNYARSYMFGAGLAGGTGSGFAENPLNTRYTADSFSLMANWRATPNFTLAGWINYNTANVTAGAGLTNADTLNWALQLAFPDAFRRGDLAGLVFGQQPYVTGNNSPIGARRDGSTNFHIEGFYRFAISDNISITPGIIYIANPENNSRNDSVWVGVVRTTFLF